MFQDMEVVYISQVLKCDASFLILSPYLRIKYRKLFIEDPNIVTVCFEPFDENKNTMTTHIVRVRVPMNRAACDELPDDCYGGFLTEYMRTLNGISTREVMSLAASCDYPLH